MITCRRGVTGQAPPGGCFLADSVRELLAREAPGGRVTVRGWLRTARHSKTVSFLEVSDGSCFAGIQAVAEPSLPNYADSIASLSTGCAVEVTGDLVARAGAPGAKDESIDPHRRNCRHSGRVTGGLCFGKPRRAIRAPHRLR